MPSLSQLFQLTTGNQIFKLDDKLQLSCHLPAFGRNLMNHRQAQATAAAKNTGLQKNIIFLSQVLK
jgi:hypothetical protein